MWRNNIKTAFRTLFRHKKYTLLNIAGLSLGIACSLFICMIVQVETGYDQFHSRKERICRVLTAYPNDINGNALTSGVAAPVPATLKNDFPDLKIADISSYNAMPVSALQRNGQVIKTIKRTVFFTEPDFFDIFDFKWLAGNAAGTLNDPNSAVLTRKTAELYFGDWKRAVGQVVSINAHFTLKVAGILDDVPQTTDFQFGILAPIRLLNHQQSTDWTTVTGLQQCYVLLPPGVKPSAFDDRLRNFSRKYRAADDNTSLVLQPLRDVHYDADNQYTGVGNFTGKMISGRRVQLLWMIAAFILSIACFNFVNLATAQAVNRAKEIGVRKVIGSNKGQLRLQFLTETMLLTLLSVATAILLVGFLANRIGQVIDIPLSLFQIPFLTLFSFLILIAALVTVLAGLYPAVVMSGLSPVKAFKSKTGTTGGKSFSLRAVLVVFQFLIAQVLIISTLVLIRQMTYFDKQSMGFEKDAIINASFRADTAENRLSYFRNRLLTVPGVRSVSFANSSPAEEDSWWTPFLFDQAAKETAFPAISKFVDSDYVNTYHLQIMAGRNIHPLGARQEFMVNETLARKLGFSQPSDVLNKEIDLWKGTAKGLIVGVVKDFHTASFKEGIAPVFFVNKPPLYNNAGIALAGNDMPGTLSEIGKVWAQVFPDYPFEYQFLNEKIAAFYRQDRQLSNLVEMFAGMAIFLSCLGLYGLASFMATQRFKEVGIRKVLGARPVEIVYLFSKDFMLFIVIAFAIAVPAAWYLTHQWLQQFTYHISVSWWLFAAGGAGSMFIALLTLTMNTWETALMNPAKSINSD